MTTDLESLLQGDPVCIRICPQSESCARCMPFLPCGLLHPLFLSDFVMCISMGTATNPIDVDQYDEELSIYVDQYDEDFCEDMDIDVEPRESEVDWNSDVRGSQQNPIDVDLTP